MTPSAQSKTESDLHRRKKPGVADRKPSQRQLHFRCEANLAYMRPSEKNRESN